jgi:predicted acylesterase/phospholipase RssA
MTGHTPSTSTTELRIACVMNGGVSLAVWMAGVTHEIDLLRRAALGRSATDADIPKYDQALWERWRERVGDRQIVVDIVAGTSAGGLNGTLLAAATAGGGRLDWPDKERRIPFLRELWEKSAGLESFLPETDAGPPRSLLDSGRFDELIKATLEALARENHLEHARNGPSPHPVTLFVTATALGESDDDYHDGFDQLFRVEDHRRRYRFRHDPEHVEFSRSECTFHKRNLAEFVQFPDALARAARASSSFPAAFEPVSEVDDMLGPPVRVQPEDHAESPAWLADGGILDNSPFGPVLQEIAHRAPDADVERLLLYVVPSRGTPAKGIEQVAAAAGAPKWTKVLGNAVVFPREADFRDDIAEIRDLLFTSNAQQQSVRLFCANAHGPGTPQTGIKLVEGATVLLPTYWRGQLAGRIREARTLAEESGTRRAPRRLKSADDVLHIDDELQQLPEEDRGAQPPAFGPDRVVLTPPWGWGVGAGERCARLFARDVMDHLAEGAPIQEEAAGLAAVLRRIQALSEALDEQLKALPPSQLVTTATARRLVDDQAENLGVPVTMQGLMREAAGHYQAAIEKLSGSATAEDVARVALAVEICDRTTRAGTPYRRIPRFTLLRLGPDVDAPALLGVAGEGARGTHLGDRKLYGTRAGHFAAFAKAEWRRHDWLWGRLDGIAHLGRALFPCDTDEAQIQEWIRDTQQLMLTNEFGGPSVQELWRATESLLSTSDAALLEQVTHGGSDRNLVGDTERRAVRMLAEEFDLAYVPAFAKRFLIKTVLRRVVGRLSRTESGRP